MVFKKTYYDTISQKKRNNFLFLWRAQHFRVDSSNIRKY